MRWQQIFSIHTSNSHEFELHRPSNKGTKLLLKVIKAIIIISLTLKFGSIQLTLSLPQSPTPWWVLSLITDARAHCDTCEQCACSRSLVYALSYVVCLLALFAHLLFPAFCINPLQYLEVRRRTVVCQCFAKW